MIRRASLAIAAFAASMTTIGGTVVLFGVTGAAPLQPTRVASA
jgi:hypothetical protein